MNKFRYRIIGAIIVVTLCVIILPMVFDGNKKHYQEEFATIPLIPEVEYQPEHNTLPPVTESLPEFNIENSDRREGLREPISGEESLPSEQTRTESQYVTPPVNVEKEDKQVAPQGEAYVIQLVALSHAKRVEEIRAKLQLNGYRVFTVPSTPVQGKLTRVFVGPDISRSKLEEQVPKLKSLTGLEGIVRKHTVIQ